MLGVFFGEAARGGTAPGVMSRQHRGALPPKRRLSGGDFLRDAERPPPPSAPAARSPPPQRLSAAPQPRPPPQGRGGGGGFQPLRQHGPTAGMRSSPPAGRGRGRSDPQQRRQWYARRAPRASRLRVRASRLFSAGCGGAGQGEVALSCRPCRERCCPAPPVGDARALRSKRQCSECPCAPETVRSSF